MIEEIANTAAEILNQRHVVGFWSMDVKVKELLAVAHQENLWWVVAVSSLHHPNIEEELLEVYLIDKTGNLISKGLRFELYKHSMKTQAPAFRPIASIRLVAK